MNSVEDPHKSTDEGLDARMLGRTEGSSSSAQPMEIMGTHMDSVDASKRPADSTQPNEIANRKHMDSVDVMRLPMDICPEAMLEHTENLSDVTPLKDEKRRKTNLQHNKPKKANKMVIPQGSYFICGYYSLRCAALFSDLTILWHTAILYARLCLHFRRYRCCQVNHVCTKKYQVCGHR